MSDSSCFHAHVTPASERKVASLPNSSTPDDSTPPIMRRRTNSEPLINFALAGWDNVDSLLVPGVLSNDCFIDLPVEPLPSAKTFDELTPQEIAEIACLIEDDVRQGRSPKPPHFLNTPEDHNVSQGSVNLRIHIPSAPIRARHATAGVHRAHPYMADHYSGFIVDEASTPRTEPVSLEDFLSMVSSPPPTSTFAPTHYASPAAGSMSASFVDPLHDGLFACGWQDCNTPPFSSMALLTAHLAHRHVPRRRSQYPCLWQGCLRGGHARPFPKRHKLVAHLRSHTHERPFTCNICGRAFAREDSRDAHVKIHSKDRVGPWGCGCQGGRVWQSWRGVRRHQATGACNGVVQLATGQPVEVNNRRRRGAAESDDDDEDDSTMSPALAPLDA